MSALVPCHSDDCSFVPCSVALLPPYLSSSLGAVAVTLLPALCCAESFGNGPVFWVIGQLPALLVCPGKWSYQRGGKCHFGCSCKFDKFCQLAFELVKQLVTKYIIIKMLRGPYHCLKSQFFVNWHECTYKTCPFLL